MKILESLQRLFLLCIALCVPFLFLPLTSDFFLMQKTYLVLFGGLLVAALLAVQLFTTRKIHSVKTPFTRILVALAVAYTISLVFASPNPLQALYAIPTGVIVIGAWIMFYFLSVYSAGVSRHALPVLQTYVYGILIAAIVVIVFYFKPLAGTTLPPLLGFLKSQFSPFGNGLETLIALGFASVVLCAYLLKTFSTGFTSKTVIEGTKLGVCVVALILVGLIVFKPADPTQGLRLPPVSISWYAALETLKSARSAFIGVGVDNFDSIFTAVKPATYNRTPVWGVNFTLASSALMHIWIETGLLGLIPMLLLTAYVIRELYGLRARNDHDALIYILGGTYVGLLLVLLPLTFASISIMFIYLTALAQKVMDYDDDSVEDFSLKKLPGLYIAIPLVLIAMVLVVGYFAGKTYVADMYFKKSIDAISRNDGQKVYEHLRTAVQINPRNERYRAQFAQLNLLLANNIARKAQPQDLAGAGQEAQAGQELTEQDRKAIGQFIQQAIAEGKALVALNPARASHWNTLAVIYRNIINVAEGAEAWTIAAYQEAIRRDPNNPQLFLNLGGVYYGQADYQNAIGHFQRAVALKPNWANAHYNLAWALYQGGRYTEASAVMKNVLQLIDKKSNDYASAKENFAMFEDKAKEASTASNVKRVEPAEAPDTQPLELPATPEAVLSPALKLPESSGPEAQIEAAPTPVSSGTDVTGIPTPKPASGN